MATESIQSFTFATPRPQRFSLPRSIVYYITMTPCSSLGFEKLQRSCKYFFSKNPVIVVDELSINEYDNFTLRNEKPLKIKKLFIEAENLVKLPFKIWVTNMCCIWSNIYQSGENCNWAEFFQTKILKSEIRMLDLGNLSLPFDGLVEFAASPYLEQLYLIHLKVTYPNGDLVPLEKILEPFPELKSVAL